MGRGRRGGAWAAASARVCVRAGVHNSSNNQCIGLQCGKLRDSTADLRVVSDAHAKGRLERYITNLTLNAKLVSL